mmetsp:Transcript_17355/g.20431  ORF Transcript_17355/g.20431 Transcript_17355/m.20431 type:complete len:140 (-) Transcript_17355:165-584(-)
MISKTISTEESPRPTPRCRKITLSLEEENDDEEDNEKKIAEAMAAMGSPSDDIDAASPCGVPPPMNANFEAVSPSGMPPPSINFPQNKPQEGAAAADSQSETPPSTLRTMQRRLYCIIEESPKDMYSPSAALSRLRGFR